MNSEFKENKNRSDTAREITGSVVGAYVLITLTVFPLFTTNMYFDILVDKYYFYLVSTICMALMLVILAAVFSFIDLKENGGENVRRAAACLKPSRLIKSLTVPDFCILAFFIVSVISTFCSEWFYEAFWGNMGRYSGLFLWIWYVVMYFAVTRLFRFKKWYLDAFLIAGLCVCIWGIQDYFQLDPHGFLADVADADKDIFTSSIGNINTYTAFVALYMGAASVLFITEGNALFYGSEDSLGIYLSDKVVLSASASGTSIVREKDVSRLKVLVSAVRFIFYGICCCIFFTALIMGQSDNAVLSLAALLCFLPFLAWKNRDGFIRYLLVLASFTGSMWFTGFISTKYADIVLPPDNGSMLIGLSYRSVWKPVTIALLTAAIVLILAECVISRRRTETAGSAYRTANPVLLYLRGANRKLPGAFRYFWLVMGLIAAALIIWVFWDANHGGHPELYAPYSNILYFNIYWGTHRGHNWSILMRHFMEFPLWKKLIGSGPETYGIVTRIYDYYEMNNMFGEIYDSAHNEYLQYMFTVGIAGLAAYLGWLVSGTARIFRRVKKNAFAKACAFAVIAYAFQAFVNITVPIVVPIFFLMLCMGLAAAREETAESKAAGTGRKS